MSTCCPNCSAPTALGNELASMCTECASVSVAGASFSLTGILACAALAITVGLAMKTIHHVRAARLVRA